MLSTALIHTPQASGPLYKLTLPATLPPHSPYPPIEESLLRPLVANPEPTRLNQVPFLDSDTSASFIPALTPLPVSPSWPWPLCPCPPILILTPLPESHYHGLDPSSRSSSSQHYPFWAVIGDWSVSPSGEKAPWRQVPGFLGHPVPWASPSIGWHEAVGSVNTGQMPLLKGLIRSLGIIPWEREFPEKLIQWE